MQIFSFSKKIQSYNYIDKSNTIGMVLFSLVIIKLNCVSFWPMQLYSWIFINSCTPPITNSGVSWENYHRNTKFSHCLQFTCDCWKVASIGHINSWEMFVSMQQSNRNIFCPQYLWWLHRSVLWVTTYTKWRRGSKQVAQREKSEFQW